MLTYSDYKEIQPSHLEKIRLTPLKQQSMIAYSTYSEEAHKPQADYSV